MILLVYLVLVSGLLSLTKSYPLEMSSLEINNNGPFESSIVYNGIPIMVNFGLDTSLINANGRILTVGSIQSAIKSEDEEHCECKRFICVGEVPECQCACHEFSIVDHGKTEKSFQALDAKELERLEKEQQEQLQKQLELAAEQRKHAAEQRQRAAEQRQRAAEQRQRAAEQLQKQLELAAEQRQHAAEQRQRAAEQRQRAAEQSQRAAEQPQPQWRNPIDMLPPKRIYNPASGSLTSTSFTFD